MDDNGLFSYLTHTILQKIAYLSLPRYADDIRICHT